MPDLTGTRDELADGVARITFARPQRANALDLPAARALRCAAERAASDPEARVVLVSGGGARFCAGDVASMAHAASRTAYLLELATEVDAALLVLDALDKPVVAQVQGVVAGAACRRPAASTRADAHEPDTHAGTALGWGLVTTVVDDEALEAEAAVLTARMAAQSTFALGQARRLVRSSWTATRAETGTDESRTIAQAVDQPSTRALIDAFVRG